MEATFGRRLTRRVGILVVGLLVVMLAACTDAGEADRSGASTPTANASASPTPAPASTSTAAPAPRPAATGTPAPLAVPGSFGQTGPLATSRSLHTATLLDDGRVLIAAGANLDLGVLDSAELYDPGATTVATQGPFDPEPPRLLTGAFVPTGALLEARQTYAATRLADGRVLVTGGVAADGAFLDSAELYDPATGAFSAAGRMTTARLAHGSTLLADGRVLIVGGFGNPHLASTEIYDPEAGTFTPAGPLQIGRNFPSIVPLEDGRVLVHGAAFDQRAAPEFYDPASGRFTLLPTPPGFRWPGQATGLLDGTVLLTGDCCAEDGFTALGSAAILDPATGSVEAIEPVREGRFGHATVLLPDGRVLLAGGWEAASESADDLASAELFDPVTRRFELVAPMSDGRRWHTATLLPDGRVLVVGVTHAPYVRAAEVFLVPPR